MRHHQSGKHMPFGLDQDTERSSKGWNEWRIVHLEEAQTFHVTSTQDFYECSSHVCMVGM